MKPLPLFFVLAIAVAANAQDKPRVFVQGKGSENVSSNGSGAGGHHWAAWGSKSTIDSHDESMEVTKDLQKNCDGVTVTINESNADYIVMMNRESKQNRGLLRTNSQIQVANKAGDVLGTNATRTVGNAAKDACTLIVADWQAHGRINVPTPAAAPTPQAATVQPAVQTSAAAQVTPAVATTPQATSVATAPSESLAEAAKREQQRKACLDLAKDNPSIVCK
ncbi:MAG TPA: hypothetical protein VJQ82_23680 [Terriglobales bacterium]|nr:hypothetical protein [Terriglobales bacterium]